MRLRVFTSLALLAVSLPAAAAPKALPADRHETVQTRVRPTLDPLGLQTGAFHWAPMLALGYEYEDNVFATPTLAVSDNILLVQPRLDVASDWSRHRLAAGLRAEISRFDSYGGEDYEDWHAYANGRLDFARSQLELGYSHDSQHQARTSPDDKYSLEPTTFSLDTLRLDYRFKPGRISVEPGLNFQHIDFDDTRIGGGTVDNSDRDRDKLRGRLRIGYAMTDSYGLFAQANVTKIQYDQATDSAGYQRSSLGWEMLAGGSIDLGGSTFGEVYAGYRHWTYDDDRFSNVDGPAFGADLTWNVSGLTTLRLSADRTIESTTIVSAAGIEQTAFGLTADHELFRNLIVSAKVSFATEDFKGIDRKDDVFAAGCGAKYLVGRHLYVLLDYRHDRRDTSPSNSGAREYVINAVSLRLQGNL